MRRLRGCGEGGEGGRERGSTRGGTTKGLRIECFLTFARPSFWDATHVFVFSVACESVTNSFHFEDAPITPQRPKAVLLLRFVHKNT
jgi:hypothetical protein